MRNRVKITEVTADHIKRVNMVMDFVERNLERELSLKSLSAKANYSPYHFHRVFLKITGETLNSFIIRKRIEKIASILTVGTHESFSELAFKYGFSSGNAFSRAFKKFYGVNPKEFKEKFSKIGVEVLTYDKYICRINNIKNAKDEYKY